MTNPKTYKITDEQIIEEIEKGMTYADISRKYNITEKSLLKRRKALALKGYSPEHKYTHQVPDGYVVKGVSQLYNARGDVVMQWVKSKLDEKQKLEALKEAIQIFCEDLPKLESSSAKKQNYDDLLVCYPLGDQHIGMRAWDKECGENWDLEIAEKVFIEVLTRLINSSPNCKECLIVNLGDFFHRDNTDGTTSRSHNILDTDGRYPKMIQVGIRLIRILISLALAKHEKVTIINCIGNHDDVSSMFLGAALQHIYENEPRLTVQDTISPYNYLTFGKVLIGAHHGHTCKMPQLPSIMACDMPTEWGNSKYRYWLTGHIHNDSKIELPGCTVESFRTLAAKDSYATSYGYRAGRDTKAIVYHKEYGEIERHIVNIDMIKDKLK